MTDIKDISQEIIKERGKRFCLLYGLEYIDTVRVDITDKVRKDFNFLEDIFVSENDFELAVNQLCHALVVMREDDEMFPSMIFLNYVYEWDVKDYFFEWIQTNPKFLLKVANIAM